MFDIIVPLNEIAVIQLVCYFPVWGFNNFKGFLLKYLLISTVSLCQSCSRTEYVTLYYPYEILDWAK